MVIIVEIIILEINPGSAKLLANVSVSGRSKMQA